MSYKNDSELVILNKYGKSSSFAKAELYETYDRIRDLTVSGPSIGGSGVGKFGSMLLNVARTFSNSSFAPTFGNESINIPGTTFFSPVSGGAGIVPGGTAAFGLAPFSQISGFPAAGGAAPIGWLAGGAAPINQFGGDISALSLMNSYGIGSEALSNIGLNGIGDWGTYMNGVNNYISSDSTAGGTIAGGAANLGGAASLIGNNIAGGAAGIAGTAGALAAGTAAGAGFGRNWVMPAAGIVSGLGGLLTTLGPFFGPFGLAAAAGGSVMSGLSGAVLQSFQNVSNRILVNADTILTNKVKNLETTIKQLDAQQDIIKKLLKESVDGDRKALDNL